MIGLGSRALPGSPFAKVRAPFFWWRLCVLLAALLSPRVSPALEVPALQSRVTDLAGVLEPEEEQRLTEQLAAIEARSGQQFAVLLVPSLDGEAIEDFSIRVVENWKLGAQGVDNGLLVLVATNDRRMRIEVGYGLEGAIPDALAGRIIRDVMVPEFRQGNYFEGLTQAVDHLGRAAAGEAISPPPRSSEDGEEAFPYLFFLIFPLFWLLPFFSRHRRGGRTFYAGGYHGGYRGGGFGGGGFSGGGGGFGGGGASGSW